MRNQLINNVDVEDAPLELSLDEEETRRKFWEDADAQKLFRSLARLRKTCFLAEKGDILDDLEQYEQRPITKKKLQELLRKFCDKALISKVDKTDCPTSLRRSPHKRGRDRDAKWGSVEQVLVFSSQPQFWLPDVDILVQYINSEMCELHKDSDQSVNTSCNVLRSVHSRKSPSVLLEPGVRSRLSSVSTSTVRKKRKTSTPQKVGTTKRRGHSNIASPEKVHKIAKSSPLSFVGKRIAIKAGSKRKLHFGSVYEFHEDGNCWYIDYDDGDGEDFSEAQLRKALKLYKKKRAYDL